jgi:hypothetical protein
MATTQNPGGFFVTAVECDQNYCHLQKGVIANHGLCHTLFAPDRARPLSPGAGSGDSPHHTLSARILCHPYSWITQHWLATPYGLRKAVSSGAVGAIT